jgi:hypothetical protein
MTFALPNQARLLVLVGAVAALIAAFLVARPLLLDSDDATSTPPVSAPATTKPAPQQPTHSTPSRALRLLPGLPAPVARKLRFEQVVVVALYSAKAPLDRKTLAHARVGAKTVGAGFVALNVLNERKARSLGKFADASASPSVIVVRRPGKIVSQFEGFVDAAIVAQAAQNAGAGKKRSK